MGTCGLTAGPIPESTSGREIPLLRPYPAAAPWLECRETAQHPPRSCRRPRLRRSRLLWKRDCSHAPSRSLCERRDALHRLLLGFRELLALPRGIDDGAGPLAGRDSPLDPDDVADASA